MDALAKDGKGKAADLPLLMAKTGFPSAMQALMPDIARRVSGALVLQLGRQIELPLDQQIDLALGAKEPVREDDLRVHLAQQSAREIAALGDNDALITKLRGRFKKTPVAQLMRRSPGCRPRFMASLGSCSGTWRPRTRR